MFKDWKTSWDFSKTAADVEPTIPAEGPNVLQIEWSSPKHTECAGVGNLWAIVQTHYILDVESKENSKQRNYDSSRANPLDTKLDGKNNFALT